MKRVQAVLTERERRAFEALLVASGPEELVVIVDGNDLYLEPTFAPKLIRELRLLDAPRGFYSGVLHVVHRAVHRRLVASDAVRKEEARAEPEDEEPPQEHPDRASPVPAFYRRLIAAVGRSMLDFEWEDAREPSQLADIRDDLHRIGIDGLEFEPHVASDAVSWTLVACRCLRCRAHVLLARPHFVERVAAPLIAAATSNYCTECGSPALQVLMPWIQESPRTDEINAMATLVRASDTHILYRPPAWGYTPRQHGVLLEARANDFIQDVREERGLLAEVFTVGIMYSDAEFVNESRVRKTLDAYAGFAAAQGFALEYGGATLQDVSLRAAALAAENPMFPRSLGFGEFPWRYVAAALLNEALAKGQDLEALERVYLSVDTALALAHVHQLAAADAAVVRGEEALDEAPSSDAKTGMSAYIAAARAEILGRDGRFDESQRILHDILPPLTADSSKGDRVRHWIVCRDDAALMRMESRFGEAITVLTQVIVALTELRSQCANERDVEVLHLATVGLSGALANLAYVALDIPEDQAVEHVDSIVSVAMRVDGPLIATIPDREYPLLARAALRLLEHALFHSRLTGVDVYAARQRWHLAKAFTRLAIRDQVEANAVLALDHALDANDNRFAGMVGVQLAAFNLRKESYESAITLVEVVALCATRAAIDDPSGARYEADDSCIAACAFAIACAAVSPALTPRALLVLENQKAVRSTNRISVVLDSRPKTANASRAADRLQTLLAQQESLRSEAMWAGEDELEPRTALSAISAEIAAVRERIAALTSVTTFLTDSRPVHHLDVADAGDCLQSLGDRTTLLGVYHNLETVWVYALWAGGCECSMLDDWSSWKDDISEVLRAMDEDEPMPASFYELGKYLLRPLAARLQELSVDDRLIVSTFGAFARFPFEALLTGCGAVLADAVTLSFASGLGMLSACLQKPEVKFDDVLVVGAPTRTTHDASDAVRAEVDEVARAFASRGNKAIVLVALEASSAEVRRHCGTSTVVHFACHGEWGNGSSVPACIYLAEGQESGVVTARDIVNGYRLRSGALVVLAACESAGMNVGHHHDDNALVHAFMVAGASTVVATRWEIRDEDTAVFVREFYAALLTGTSAATALARTIRRARAGALGEQLAEPKVWAAFAVFGR